VLLEVSSIRRSFTRLWLEYRYQPRSEGFRVQRQTGHPRRLLTTTTGNDPYYPRPLAPPPSSAEQSDLVFSFEVDAGLKTAHIPDSDKTNLNTVIPRGVGSGHPPRRNLPIAANIASLSSLFYTSDVAAAYSRAEGSRSVDHPCSALQRAHGRAGPV